MFALKARTTQVCQLSYLLCLWLQVTQLHLTHPNTTPGLGMFWRCQVSLLQPKQTHVRWARDSTNMCRIPLSRTEVQWSLSWTALLRGASPPSPPWPHRTTSGRPCFTRTTTPQHDRAAPARAGRDEETEGCVTSRWAPRVELRFQDWPYDRTGHMIEQGHWSYSGVTLWIDMILGYWDLGSVLWRSDSWVEAWYQQQD